MFNEEQQFAGRIYCPEKVLTALKEHFGVTTTEGVFHEAYCLHWGSALGSLPDKEIHTRVTNDLESARESGKLMVYVITAYRLRCLS